MKRPDFFMRIWREEIQARLERGPEVVHCASCGWTPRWEGFRTGRYVVRTDGKRIVYTKPEEECQTIKEATGLDWKDADKAGLLGMRVSVVCWGCGLSYVTDLERDKKQCPHCGGLEGKTRWGAVGAVCPKCHSGLMTGELEEMKNYREWLKEFKEKIPPLLI